MYVSIVKDITNIGFMMYMQSEHALKVLVGVGCPSMLLFISCLFLLIESSFMYGHVHELAALAAISEARQKLADDKKRKEEMRIYNNSAEVYYLQQMTPKVNPMEAPYPWSNGDIKTSMESLQH